MSTIVDGSHIGTSTSGVRRGTQRRRGPLHCIGLGLSAVLLALFGLIGALVILVPAVSGATPTAIPDGSMQSTYPPGTLIVVQPTATDHIAVGDEITYQSESGATVTGRVWYAVPYIGHVAAIIAGDDRTWVLPIGAVALLAYTGWMLASGRRATARYRREQRDRAHTSTY